MGENLTSKNGALWAQLGGPNSISYYLGCKDLGDLDNPKGGIEITQCFDPSGDGWKTTGQKRTPPEKVSTSIEGLMFAEQDYLENINCQFSLIVLQSDCGRLDLMTNYVRGWLLSNARIANEKNANLVKRTEDTEALFSVDIEARPPIWKFYKLGLTRPVNADVDASNDIAANLQARCYEDCGATMGKGQNVITASDSAVGPAVSVPMTSVDYGTTWAATTAPFAAGMDIKSVQRFYISRTTERTLVAMDAPAGAQGMVAYSDNGGTTWTIVNVGGAVAGHGAVYGRGLFALDMQHIWLAGAAGFIYFSSDGGATWTVQEGGAIHAGAYYFVHFSDTKNGLAGGAAGVCAKTIDGGVTWQATTVPVAAAMWTGWCLDANRFWVGGAAGALYYSTNGGTTWALRGFPGSGVGIVHGISFAPGSDMFAFMCVDSAGVVGTVLRTFDGGYTWEAQATPVNSGLTGILAVDQNTAYAVGLVNAATTVVLKIVAA